MAGKKQKSRSVLKDSHIKVERRAKAQGAGYSVANRVFEQEVTGHRHAEERERAFQRLLLAMTRAQSLFIDEAKPEAVFGALLQELLDLTSSKYGFIGEVVWTAERIPFLRTHAITDIAWNEDTKALMAQQAPTLEFKNLKTLFGHVMTTGKPVISNDPAHDSRAGGLPPGHLPMHAFLGLPIYRGELLTGMVGMANRPGGYDESLITYLQPFLSTCAQLLEGYRNRRLRTDAEVALRGSEERWQLAVQGSSDGIWDWDLTSNKVYFSPRWKEMLGYGDHEILGDYQEWESRLHPEDQEQVISQLTAYLEGRVEQYTVEFRLRKKDGEYCWIQARGKAMWDAEGRPYRMAGSHTDITERKREEALQAAEKRALELVAKGAGLPEVLTFICRTIEEHTAPMLTSIMLVTEDGQHLRCAAAPSLPDDYNRAVDGIPIGPTVGSCGSAAYYGKPSIVVDIAMDPLWSNYAAITMGHGLHACWSQPILGSTGTVLGTFAAYYKEPRTPGPADLAVVERAGHLAAVAIQHSKMSEALRESEARFHAFMAHSPAVSFIKDSAGRHLYVNPTFERLLGVSLSDIRGKTLDGWLPSDVVAQLRVNDEKVLASGEPLEVEETVPTPDGKIQQWLVLKFPLTSSSGERLLGGVAIDITSRKLAEESLQRTRFAMDQAVDAVYWIDPQARILYTNEAASKMLGYTADEFLRMTVHDLNPNFPPEVWPGFWAETREKKIISLETVHLTKDRRRIPIDVRVSFLAYGGQEFHCAFVRDITERKRAEEEQLRMHTLLTNVINTTPDLVIVKDRQLRTVLCNQATANMIGKEPADLVGHTDIENGWDPELVHGNPDKGIRGYEQDDRTAMSGQIVRNSHDLVCVNGIIRIFDTYKVPLRDERGGIAGVLGIARDVTERKRMEDALDALVRGTGAVTGEAFFPVFVRELAVALGVKYAVVADLVVSHVGSATIRAMWNGSDWADPYEYALAGTPCELVSREGVVCYPSAVQRLFPNDTDLAKCQAESYLGVLLRNRAGMAMGHIFVMDDQPLVDPSHATAIIQIFAARASAELERLKADEALRASQERFELAVRGTDDGIWDWNIVTGESYWSERIYELLGLQPGELAPSYEAWMSVLHPADAQSALQALRRHLDGREPYDIEIRVKRKDGEYRWFREQGQAVWDVTGRPVRMVGSSSDVTDRRNAEEALRKAHAELEQRVKERTRQLEETNRFLQEEIAERERIEDRLRTTQYAVDHAADQIFVIGPNGYFLDLNESACRRLGYTKEELLSMSVMDVDPDFSMEVWDKFWAEFSNSKRIRLETRHRGKSGEIYPVEVVANYLWHNGQELDYAIVRDITERKEMEMRLARHAEELECQVVERTAEIAKLESQRAQAEKLAALGQLAAGVAHEINNPVAGIQMAFTLVKQAVDPAHPHFEFVGMIDREIARVESIVANMYQLYRKEPRKAEAVDLQTVICSLEGLFAKRMSQQGVSFAADVPPSMPRLHVSIGDLLQVLMNLLQNAIDSSKPGGMITLRVRQEDGLVKVMVSDEGAGIAPAVLPHIFDPFFTTKTERDQKRMGLGLSISQSLVMAMGGKIEVQTQPNGGSTFAVLLPHHRADPCSQGQLDTTKEVVIHDC